MDDSHAHVSGTLEHIVQFLHTEGALRSGCKHLSHPSSWQPHSCAPPHLMYSSRHCQPGCAPESVLLPDACGWYPHGPHDIAHLLRAGFYVAEEALLRELDLRGPNRAASPAEVADLAPSAVASSDEGERAQQAPRVPPVRRTPAAVARRKAGSRLNKASGAAAAELPMEIKLAEPVRCALRRPGRSQTAKVF